MGSGKGGSGSFRQPGRTEKSINWNVTNLFMDFFVVAVYYLLQFRKIGPIR